MALEILKWDIDTGQWAYPVVGVDKINFAYVDFVSGTDIKTVNGSSLLGSGDLTVSSSISITETEIDVGSTPVSEATINIEDPAMLATSKVIGGVAYEAPTGKDLDEIEMDAFDVKFEPVAGGMNIWIKGLEGYIADKFKIWYTFA